MRIFDLFIVLKIDLGTVWYGLLVINDLDVTTATQFEQAFIRLSWILY